MRKLIALVLLVDAACGYSSTDNEAVGQVKKVKNMTPIICSDYVSAHISLGVMRNGVGSMSREDIEIAVEPNEKAAIDKLKWAAENGAIVKVQYNVERTSPCWPDHRLTGEVVLEAVPAETP